MLFRKSGTEGGGAVDRRELRHFFFLLLLRHMHQFRIMENFVLGILIEHCVAVAFLTSGRFRKGFA
jgi:hypothetical protein